MASIYEVTNVVRKFADNLEKECGECMNENQSVVRDCIQEQLYSGLDGSEHLLKPTYDDDPYFNEEGPWKNRAEQYKRWKERITPPIQSYLLNFPARPVEVPNLFIIGTFYDSIHTKSTAKGIQIITTGFVDGSDIVRKYGDEILSLGPTAKEYFIINHLRPWILRYMKECGIK